MADKQIIKSGSIREIFWDFECLDRAMFKQPYISSLCNQLDIGSQIVNKEEAVEAVCQRVLS